MSNRHIYFNEAKHKYTDDFGNVYVSATTLIGKYEYKFADKQDDIVAACVRIGKNPNHPKHERYKGMTAEAIFRSWDKVRDKSLDRGNSRHNYLEDSIKSATGFIRFRSKLPGGRLYTIDDILIHHSYGRVDLDTFIKAGVLKKYPRIFKIVKALVDDGWRLYSEIGVYNADLLISGLIDILAVKGDEFIILDWKTNKYPIQFLGGYYEKDNKGNVTNYKVTNEVFKPPLGHLQQSTGMKYTMQLSLYAYLVEMFGLKYRASIICQILDEPYTVEDDVPNSWIGKEKVNTVEVNYHRSDIQTMIDDYIKNRESGQLSLLSHY